VDWRTEPSSPSRQEAPPARRLALGANYITVIAVAVILAVVILGAAFILRPRSQTPAQACAQSGGTWTYNPFDSGPMCVHH
jgi:hypothetical protein